MFHPQPTEWLKEEHKAIKIMLQILEKVSQKLESGEEVNPDHLDQMVRFIREFADRCHHAKEEDLLFPAMIEAGVPKEGGPIAVMLTEHDEGRGYVRQMKEAAEKYRAGDRDAWPQFVKNARNYVSLLSQHIDKEDAILYEMAKVHISSDRMEKLWQDFERVEREDIGVGVHEDFEKLLKGLKKIYLEVSK